MDCDETMRLPVQNAPIVSADEQVRADIDTMIAAVVAIMRSAVEDGDVARWKRYRLAHGYLLSAREAIA